MRMIHDNYTVQQQRGSDEHFKFIKKLFATGKCLLECPPDCFIWTGTKEDLEMFIKANQEQE